MTCELDHWAGDEKDTKYQLQEKLTAPRSLIPVVEPVQLLDFPNLVHEVTF